MKPSTALARPRPSNPVARRTSGPSQLHSPEDPADATLTLNLLTSGKRVFKGKLRQVDPSSVRRSRFANRAVQDVSSAYHQQLAELMKQSGTNAVPALAQELEVTDEAGMRLELVYGHRRHQVCLSEALPFTVIVVPALSDVERTFLMSSENEGRISPCPLDLGVWLSGLLEEGSFVSQAALARTVNIKPASVTNLLKLARLPAQVVAAFNDRSELAHRHAVPLDQAATEDLEGLISRAEAIATLRASLDAPIHKKQIVAMLTGNLPIEAEALKTGSTPSSTHIVSTVLYADEPPAGFKEEKPSPMHHEVQADASEEAFEASPRQNVKRFNAPLPLVTDCGKAPGQVFTDDDGDTFIRLPFDLDADDLDWFATTLGELLTHAPFLHKTRLLEEHREIDHG